MRKRTIHFGLGTAIVLVLIATPFLLAPRPGSKKALPIATVESSEQAQTIDAMKPPKRKRPAIAIATFNQATEVTDFLVAYGVLRRADVADVTVVAERAEPVRLYPSLSIEPGSTMQAFDQQYPGGADYVVIPAMDPGTDPFVASWIASQYRKGARIVSICNGSRMAATAGLLDNRRATGHWSAIAELTKKHPTMQWAKDRRYVTDNGVTTATGITASIPVMIALVEAIAGRETAARVARDVGVETWDARHRSADFELTYEHRKTFVRNNLTLWRHETVGIPVAENVDEIALGLTVDAYSRTELANVVTLGRNGEAVRSRYGLMIRPDRATGSVAVDDMLLLPSPDAPARTIERELARIESRYDRSTAEIVALVMEYPWL